MADGEFRPVEVSRRIEAPAAVVFQVLADPARHPELDGSGMLRGAVSCAPITAAGDVFVMKMYFPRLGDYEMNNHVVEYERDRRIGWEPEAGRGHPGSSGEEGSARWGHRWTYELTPDGPDATIVTEIYDCSRAPENERVGMDNGNVWREAMETTLERLDSLCTAAAHQPHG
ncbi:MAG TPA: SRPBCC family protein [Acidimicrobiales bacterium]|nr:SRPBCC family protein [Acidimicrobiales bacterium]